MENIMKLITRLKDLIKEKSDKIAELETNLERLKLENLELKNKIEKK
jgi:hypothetical protein